jgi:hypothetical protein
MQAHELPKEKQPDAVSDQLPSVAPSLWLYVSLIAIAGTLIAVSFSMHVDWPGLLLNLAASLIAAVVLLIFVDRRLRASEVGRIRRFPREVGLRSLLLVSPRHRHFHAYAKAFLSVLEAKLLSRVVPANLGELIEKIQHNSVLLGDPGTGKTTRLQMLAAHWAREYLKHQTQKTPILFPLRLWRRHQSLEEALLEHVKGFAPVWRWSFRRTLRQGKAIVMFDGVDELPPETSQAFSMEFAHLRANYPAVTWIVSTRPGVDSQLDDFAEVILPSLTADEMRRVGERRQRRPHVP